MLSNVAELAKPEGMPGSLGDQAEEVYKPR